MENSSMEDTTTTTSSIISNRRMIVIVCSFITCLSAISMFGYLLYYVIDRRTYISLLAGLLVVCFVVFFAFLTQAILSLKIKKLGSIQLKKIEKITMVFGILLVILFPIGGYALNAFGNETNIAESYSWNDGPWLTFGEDPKTEMSISWLTKFARKTAIEFGTSHDNLVAIESTNPKSHLHHIMLTNLQPNTVYYYSIGIATSTYPANEVFSFRTAPDTNESFKAIIVGDMQPSPGATLQAGNLVAKGIAAEYPDFVIQLGDLAYDGGAPISWHYTAQNFPQYAAYTPFQVAIGNHDYGGDGARNFRNVFPYPYASEIGQYYSFDYASAHFIMIDNFDAGDYTMTNEQKLWVEQDIIDAQTRGQNWIFINFHHTMFTTGTSSQNWAVQSWLAPLVDKYDVDGIFFGHDHHFEHWNFTYGNQNLLYNETDMPSGNSTHYWCTGGGGANLEVDYGVLEHDIWTDTRSFFNTTSSSYQEIEFHRYPWNASRFVNSPEHQIYAQSVNHGLYYHIPSLESYSTDNDLYGYTYGEQTRHYMKIEINADGTICTISAHYPNGDLMTGPDGHYPQIWIFSK
ncbi:MAG: metallophosphoesterase family protein [Asgard group archaeon]|nr:metallophosphoesterase family protein [Asgard group archaeon]